MSSRNRTRPSCHLYVTKSTRAFMPSRCNERTDQTHAQAQDDDSERNTRTDDRLQLIPSNRTSGSTLVFALVNDDRSGGALSLQSLQSLKREAACGGTGVPK